RLHPECAPAVMEDIRALLGEDLIPRPRHGRIRLRDRWVHFPLRPLDLVSNLPLPFLAGAARDALTRPLRMKTVKADTFAGIMERNLGGTLCGDFYFPYARKVWGIPPEEISPIQAQKRVSANSPAKLVRKALGALPGVGLGTSRSFYYPRGGYGQISQAYYDAAVDSGVAFALGQRVSSVEHSENRAIAVHFGSEGATERTEADYVWSTIPMPLLARLMEPAAPSAVLAASEEMEFRAMVLVYLVLDTPQFTPYDAHYFPEEHISISRLSEPKNYSGVRSPGHTTVICAEIPCSLDSEAWSMDDASLGRFVMDGLQAAGLPVDVPVATVESRKLRHAYPVYRLGFEEAFATMDRWLAGFENLLTFGRQGLFAHDNTHHTLEMAYAAVDCLGSDGSFDRGRWGQFRVAFEQHAVVD
ncbi:MAG: FAD-dependent oxidoreductase, partial [Dehalococcoidia bacterium]